MNTKLLLTLSLLLNAAAAIVIGLWLTKSKSPQAIPPTVADAPATVARKPLLAREDLARSTAANAPAKLFDWRTVESSDYRQYIENLRAIGCPEETIRDIITADVNKLFEARRKELRGASTNRFQFWKTGNPLGDLLNEERMAKNQELSNEKRALLKELLGANYTEKPDLAAAFNPYEEILDFLPSGKQNELMELEQKFAARLMKTLKDAQKGNYAAMREVQREKDAELAKMLSPQEKEEYDLRLSQTAALMRLQMGDFQPTEQEFRDLFKLQKQFDDEYGLMGMQSNNAEERKKRETAQKELYDQARKILSEDHYLEYRYSQNFSRSSLNKVAEEYQVPRQNALKVFEVQADAQEQARQVRADTSLSPEQRQRTLDGIRSETEKEVGRLIGDKAKEAYVEKGSWIKNLNRATTTGSGSGNN